jgi:hypothetical protein
MYGFPRITHSGDATVRVKHSVASISGGDGVLVESPVSSALGDLVVARGTTYTYAVARCFQSKTRRSTLQLRIRFPYDNNDSCLY